MAKLTLSSRAPGSPSPNLSVALLLSRAFRLMVSLAIALFILLAVYNTLAGPAPESHNSSPTLPGAHYQVTESPSAV